jgi:hypothetical protein
MHTDADASFSCLFSGALTAHEETSAKRIAAIFRRLGISHLGVSDESNTLVGVITRRHLIKPPVSVPLVSVRSARHVLSPSPEVAVDLSYATEATLESSAMDSIALVQRRSVMQRRTNSILMGVEPAVRFDDEEDETDRSESIEPTPESEYTDSQHDQAFRDATGGALEQVRSGRSRADSEASTNSGLGGINTTGGSSSKKKQSSLSRLNAYTKEYNAHA